MRKINEVLRLRAAGLTVRDIARSTGAGRTTVYEYLVRADAAGLSWPLPPDMGDDEVEAALFPPLTAELAERRPVPDWRYVHRELHRGRHVTLRLLWLEWRQDHPDGWGYTQFCVHYRAWLGTQDVVMRLAYPAGPGCSSTTAATRCRWSTRAAVRSPRPRCSWPCSAARACSSPKPAPARTSPAG